MMFIYILYQHNKISMSQSELKQQNFIKILEEYQIWFLHKPSFLKIVLISSQTFSISEQTYTINNLPKAGITSFKSHTDLYKTIISLRDKSAGWFVPDPTLINILIAQKQLLRITLNPVIDPAEIARISLMRHMYRAESTFQKLNEDVRDLNDAYGMVGTKLKGVGELFEQQNNNIVILADQGNKLQKRTQKTEASLRKVQKLQPKLQQLKQSQQSSQQKINFNLDILHKTMQRNNQSLTEQVQTLKVKTEKQIKSLQEMFDSYDFPKIKKDYQRIIELFRLQIQVKDYTFLPDKQVLAKSKGIRSLGRIIKNLQDCKDFNKIVGVEPFPPGLSKFRITANIIKNNSLIIGICSRIAKDRLSQCIFNNPQLLTLSSCGYLTNNSAMTPTNAKMKNGDIIKVLVNKSQGMIKWFINDIQVALADLGLLSSEQIYPVIGLGYFNDQIEILEESESKAKQVKRQTYKQQLHNLNQQMGVTRYRQ